MIDISPGSLDSSLCFIQPEISHEVFCLVVKLAGWQYTALMYSFPNFEPVCSVSNSNCCFLTWIQVSPETGKVVWCSHLLDFLQFVVIHTVKGFAVVDEAEVDVFLEFPCFLYDLTDGGNLISGLLPFLNPDWTSGSFSSHTAEAKLEGFWALPCWHLQWGHLYSSLYHRAQKSNI